MFYTFYCLVFYYGYMFWSTRQEQTCTNPATPVAQLLRGAYLILLNVDWFQLYQFQTRALLPVIIVHTLCV